MLSTVEEEGSFSLFLALFSLVYSDCNAAQNPYTQQPSQITGQVRT